jgi:hypothetical protein
MPEPAGVFQVLSYARHRRKVPKTFYHLFNVPTKQEKRDRAFFFPMRTERIDNPPEVRDIGGAERPSRGRALSTVILFGVPCVYAC